MPDYLKQTDAVFLRMEGTRTPMHVGLLLRFRLPARAKATFLTQLLDDLRSRQPAAPFNRRLAATRLARIVPAWEDAPGVDMDFHVRHSALPQPGGERELGMLLSRLHSQRLDLSRPPWELHLIEGLEQRRFAIYLKMHRSCADGAAAVAMLNHWLSEDSADRGEPASLWESLLDSTGTEQAAPTASGRLERLLETADRQLAASWELSRAWRDMRRRDYHPEGGQYSARQTPRTPFNVRISPQRRFATQVYQAARFKALRAATGASTTDIVLTIIGGAMRRYLMEYNALPARSMIASVPMALPRADAPRGSVVADFAVPLASDRADPRKRLERIHAVTTDTRKAMRELSSTALEQFTLLGALPMVLGHMSGLNARLPPLCNISVSNIRGPGRPLFLRGAELESIFPMSMLFDGYALNLSLVGYADRFCLGFIGCREALPHLQRLAVYTGLALEDLEAAVATMG